MAHQRSPAVSVVVPALDAASTLPRTLQPLVAQDCDHPFEVLVVDDGSTDQTAEIARQYAPLVTVLRNGSPAGPGAARNRGVAAARAPVLAFTDADCFPTRTWLAAGLEAVERADIVQGRVVPDPSVARTPFDRTLAVEGDGGFYQTANLFVRRRTFDAVGGFRDWALERPGRRRWSRDVRRGRAMRTPIGEDTFFAWSARRRGARSAFAADAVVHHAVVAGRLQDALADRWHWTRDMPGLVGLVPELRAAILYKRYFFARWSAQFDLAVASVVAAALTKRPWLAAAALPYLRRVLEDATLYADPAPGMSARTPMLTHVAGAPALDAVTLAGLLRGSAEWRALVL